MRRDRMLTPPTITEGRTIRRMPAKRRDSWVMTTSMGSKNSRRPEDRAAAEQERIFGNHPFMPWVVARWMDWDVAKTHQLHRRCCGWLISPTYRIQRVKKPTTRSNSLPNGGRTASVKLNFACSN